MRLCQLPIPRKLDRILRHSLLQLPVHGQERYDCLLSESESSTLQFSQLMALLQCRLPSGRLLDIAVVHKFMSHAKWKPNTIWDGCKLLEEDKFLSFLLMDEVVRGALLAPAFG